MLPQQSDSVVLSGDWWRRHILILALLCLLPAAALAGAVKGIVFSAVLVTPVEAGHRISIGFNYPVQYVSYFPPSPHQEVLVHIRLLEADALAGRMPVREESAALDAGLKDLLEDIRFDGTEPTTPLVVLRFLHKVHYRIEQGGDWRSLVVYVFDDPRQEDIAPPEAEVIDDPAAPPPEVDEARP